MDFTLNDEQRLLAESVERFVQTEYGFEARKRRLGADPGFSPALWLTIAELGLLALHVPEDFGGLGGSAIETMIVMEAFGRGLVLEPFLPTGVIAARLLARHGSAAQQEALLPGLAEGRIRFALAALEPQSRFNLADVQTTAQPGPDGYVLNGRKSVVLHGAAADQLIVSARMSGDAADPNGIGLFVVPATAAGVTVKDFPTIDNQRSAEISLDNVAAERLGDAGFAALEWAVDAGIAALCAEAVGAMDKLTELTIEYLQTRKQFGRPIGAFQTLQHRVADMLVAVEQARALAILAAAKVDSPDRAERRRAVSAAKMMAGQSGRYVGQQATQLHGGMGMTDEMASGHYFKRLTAIDMSFGDSRHHTVAYGTLFA